MSVHASAHVSSRVFNFIFRRIHPHSFLISLMVCKVCYGAEIYQYIKFIGKSLLVLPKRNQRRSFELNNIFGDIVGHCRSQTIISTCPYFDKSEILSEHWDCRTIDTSNLRTSHKSDKIFCRNNGNPVSPTYQRFELSK